jgi:predicted  nucleic acid-binding Zn-ribbon protein
MARKEKLEFAGVVVEIDPENLRFNEASLSKYIQTEAGYYDNFGAYLSLAERNLQNLELRHEKLAADRFVEAKEAGGSDKLAEAKAKADQDVVALKEQMNDARYAVNRLKQHLRAWDKNHDNAQSMGHMQRKMMDKLNSDITGGKYMGNSVDDELIQETVKSYEESESSGFAADLSSAMF